MKCFISGLSFAVCTANAQLDSDHCTLQPKFQERLQAAAKATAEKELTFFVGLYSKVETQDRAELSMALKDKDQLASFKEIETVQARLAERLRLDKELLQTWIIQRGIQHEVEILRLPANNHFVLFKTSPAIATDIICASAAGELPSSFGRLGF